MTDSLREAADRLRLIAARLTTDRLHVRKGYELSFEEWLKAAVALDLGPANARTREQAHRAGKDAEGLPAFPDTLEVCTDVDGRGGVVARARYDGVLYYLRGREGAPAWKRTDPMSWPPRAPTKERGDARVDPVEQRHTLDVLVHKLRVAVGSDPKDTSNLVVDARKTEDVLHFSLSAGEHKGRARVTLLLWADFQGISVQKSDKESLRAQRAQKRAWLDFVRQGQDTTQACLPALQSLFGDTCEVKYVHSGGRMGGYATKPFKHSLHNWFHLWIKPAAGSSVTDLQSIVSSISVHALEQALEPLHTLLDAQHSADQEVDEDAYRAGREILREATLVSKTDSHRMETSGMLPDVQDEMVRIAISRKDESMEAKNARARGGAPLWNTWNQEQRARFTARNPGVLVGSGWSQDSSTVDVRYRVGLRIPEATLQDSRAVKRMGKDLGAWFLSYDALLQRCMKLPEQPPAT